MAADQVTQTDSTDQQTAELFKGQIPELALGAVAAVLTANKGPTAMTVGAVDHWIVITNKNGTKGYIPVWI